VETFNWNQSLNSYFISSIVYDNFCIHLASTARKYVTSNFIRKDKARTKDLTFTGRLAMTKDLDFVLEDMLVRKIKAKVNTPVITCIRNTDNKVK